MTRPHISEAIRTLLRSGLTIRDVAEPLRALPRAIGVDLLIDGLAG